MKNRIWYNETETQKYCGGKAWINTMELEEGVRIKFTV